MRWRAHLRLRRPGAMLLWDNLDVGTGGSELLGRVLEELGFVVAVETLERMAPPALEAVDAVLRDTDLSLILADPDLAEPELLSFPGITGGPWVEQAKLDQAIVVVYGHLQLGRSTVGFADLAVEDGEVLAAVVPFRD